MNVATHSLSFSEIRYCWLGENVSFRFPEILIEPCCRRSSSRSKEEAMDGMKSKCVNAQASIPLYIYSKLWKQGQ